jgi:hypothetical protein
MACYFPENFQEIMPRPKVQPTQSYTYQSRPSAVRDGFIIVCGISEKSPLQTQVAPNATSPFTCRLAT